MSEIGNYVGIDYSMSSPAIVTCPKNKEFNFGNCLCFYLTDKKKLMARLHPNVIATAHRPEYFSNEFRFKYIGAWATNMLNVRDSIILEGYAMGAKGNTFTIGENTGVLKHLMFNKKILHNTAPPTTIKKFATGKGNANKEDMYIAFVEETGVNLMSFFPSKVLCSPVSDIVDAFYMAKYAYHIDNIPLSAI